MCRCWVRRLCVLRASLLQRVSVCEGLRGAVEAELVEEDEAIVVAEEGESGEVPGGAAEDFAVEEDDCSAWGGGGVSNGRGRVNVHVDH